MGLGGGKTLAHCSMLSASSGERGVFRKDGVAKLDKLFGEARAFCFGLGAAEGRGVMLVLGVLGALPCGLHVRANTRKLALANGKFQTKTRKLALHVAVPVGGGDDFALDFALLRVDFLKR